MDKQFFQLLKDNIFGLILSIITGILISKYYASKVLVVKKQQIVSYKGKDYHNFSNKFEVSYNGIPIENLQKTGFWIYNKGKQEIRNNDIPIKAPLIIKTKRGAKILDSCIAYTSSEACDMELQQIDDDTICFSFDFINRMDGCFIEIIHTEYLESIKWKLKGTNIKSSFFLNLKKMPGSYIFFIIFYYFYVIFSGISFWKPTDFLSMIFFIAHVVIFIAFTINMFVPIVPMKLFFGKRKKIKGEAK